MKTLKIFVLLICAISISCKEDKPKSTVNDTKLTAKVQHYICANKCENSGGPVAGNCPTCNTPYLHNQAFHNDEFLKNGPLNVPNNTQTTNQNLNATTPSSPAQNALGVYHYTCNNGCAGGAGEASNCKTCGNVLTHNQAYHTN
tara:strand:+ start:358 stop:789 length:432 start_codon:yes stop_codon:yes gene_type:complete